LVTKKNIRKNFILLLVFSLSILLWTTANAQIRNGIQKTYYDTGEIKQELSYKNGKKDGVEKQYDKDGKLLKELYYQDGKFQGEVQPETIRNYGYLSILKSWKLWAIIIGVLTGGWFLLTGLIFKNKSF
jgi:hypothetical protein